MKNLQRKSTKLTLSALFFVMATFIISSCNKDDNNVLSSDDSQNVNSESASDSYSDDASDMSSVAVGNVSSTTYSGARSESEAIDSLKLKDYRFTCATFSITRTGTKDAPSGVITI